MKNVFFFVLLISYQLFAGIGMGESNVKPLPVELSTFNVVIESQGVSLEWTTATELNNYGFYIERTLQSTEINPESEYIVLGFVKGSGNSNSQKLYSFHDPLEGKGIYVYRLKQTDTDGKFRYIKTIEVNMEAPQEYELLQNYPNPFNPTTTISYTLANESDVKITIYNTLGKEVAKVVNDRQNSGSYSLNFNAANLSSGIYFYRIEAYSIKGGNPFIATQKMTIVK